MLVIPSNDMSPQNKRGEIDRMVKIIFILGAISAIIGVLVGLNVVRM